MGIESVLRENLRVVVAAYRKATRHSLNYVSKEFYGNTAFLEEFLSGKRSISLHKLDVVLDDLRARWPDGATWPFTRAAVVDPPARGKSVPRKRTKPLVSDS